MENTNLKTLIIGLTPESAFSKASELGIENPITLEEYWVTSHSEETSPPDFCTRKMEEIIYRDLLKRQIPDLLVSLDNEMRLGSFRPPLPTVTNFAYGQVWVEYEDFGWHLARNKTGEDDRLPTVDQMAYSAEEERLIFARAVLDLTRRTAERESNVAEACEAVAFRILNLLDGTNAEFSGYELTVKPHPSDREYNLSHKRRYHKETSLSNGEYLHHVFSRLANEE